MSSLHCERHGPARAQSVEEALGLEQQRLATCLGQIRLCVEAGELRAAGSRLERFRQVLQAHAQGEELLLYETLARNEGGAREVLARMRLEHRRLRRLAGRLSAALASGDPALYLDELCALESLLERHSSIERDVLYRKLDRLGR